MSAYKARPWLSLLLFATGCVGAPYEVQNKEDAAQDSLDGKSNGSLDLCERRGWYGDGACDWFCPKKDPDCVLAPLGPEPSGQATRYPIVLAHGFDASPTNRWGFYKVAEALERDGHRVIVAEVPPYDSPAVRASHLATYVDQALAEGAPKVNLIAHSMGGLDSRHLVSGLGYGSVVASLTTISSPHRGSAVADFMLAVLPGAADDLVNRIASAWGSRYSDVADDSHFRDALLAISEANAESFNDAHPDDPGVYYQSWAGVSSILGLWKPELVADCEGQLLMHEGAADRMDLTLAPLSPITGHGTAGLANDGMATVRSAKWGSFRGCIPADHLDEVGQVADEGTDPDTGFDHVRFYRNIAFELADKGM